MAAGPGEGRRDTEGRERGRRDRGREAGGRKIEMKE